MLFPPGVFAFYEAEALACSGFFWQPFPTRCAFPGTRLFLPMHKYLQCRYLNAQLRRYFLVLFACRPHVQNRSLLFLRHRKTSSRLVAAGGGKKGRFRSFDCDAVLAPEKELRTAIGMNRHLRDQQAPYTITPNY